MKAILSIFISVLFLFAWVPAYAAGPWKGKVIDSETKEPLEGAVVLIVWDRAFRTPAGDNTYFYNAKEALTDKDGSFEIPSYTPINLLPLICYIQEPEFTIFKPGYGSLQMALGKYLTGEILKIKEMELSGKIYRLSPGIIELPKLKTREERIEVVGSLPPLIPDKKMTKLIKLINKERVDLGLQPTHLWLRANKGWRK